jgi:hypothetical protein
LWLEAAVPEEVTDMFDYNLQHGIGRLERIYSSGQFAKGSKKGGKASKKGDWNKGYYGKSWTPKGSKKGGSKGYGDSKGYGGSTSSSSSQPPPWRRPQR